MISKDELLKAIRECEANPNTFQCCEKLATFYTIYDHLYGPVRSETVTSGDSEFLKLIDGKDSERIMLLIDELVTAVSVTNPRLYKNFLDRIKEV